MSEKKLNIQTIKYVFIDDCLDCKAQELVESLCDQYWENREITYHFMSIDYILSLLDDLDDDFDDDLDKDEINPIKLAKDELKKLPEDVLLKLES